MLHACYPCVCYKYLKLKDVSAGGGLVACIHAITVQSLRLIQIPQEAATATNTVREYNASATCRERNASASHTSTSSLRPHTLVP